MLSCRTEKGMVGSEQDQGLMDKICELMESYPRLLVIPQGYGTEVRFNRVDIPIIHSGGVDNGEQRETPGPKTCVIDKSAILQILRVTSGGRVLAPVDG